MDEIRTPIAQDTAIESVVLRQLLALHPIQLSVGDLSREISGETSDFAQADAIERAIRELAAAGLVHHMDSLVIPSRAALRLDELLG